VLVRQLLEVCVLRRGPQDLPYSVPATAAALVALLALQVAAGTWHDAPVRAVAGQALVTLLLLPGVTAPLLRARGFDNRLAQTLLAQAGTGFLFTLAMLPAAMVLLPYAVMAQAQAQVTPPPQAALAAFAGIVLFVWKLRVDAWIWMQALDLRRPRALLLAVILVIAELLLVPLFAGPVPAPAAS
jgi:hypothetical protein